MEKLNKLTYSLVALVVMILVIATVAIPIISAVESDTLIVKQNSEGIRFTLADTDSDTTIHYVKNESALYVNDELMYQIGQGTTYLAGVAGFADTFYIHAGVPNSPFVLWTTEYVYPATADWTIVISDGSWSAYGATENTNPKSGTCSYAYLPDNDGDYAFYQSTASTPICIDKTSNASIMLPRSNYGITVFTNMSKISNDMTIMYYAAPVASVPPEGVEVDLSVELIDKGTYWEFVKATYADPSTSVEATVNYIIAPIAYHIPTTNSSLLSILPLILLCVPVVAIVRIFVNRGD